MQKTMDLEITARLDGKVLAQEHKFFDLFMDNKGIYWDLLLLAYQLGAFLRYTASIYGFDKTPKVGHLVVTISCGDTAETILDMHGMVLLKVSDINDLLEKGELYRELVVLFLKHLGD